MDSLKNKNIASLAKKLLLLAAVRLLVVHRQQLIVIEYLQAENRLLKESLRGKRIQFTDAERALLVRKAMTVGRRAPLKLSGAKRSL